MGGFTKLFSRILTSSIWSESNEVRIVWITLLAATGYDGIARVTVPGLSRLANIPIDQTRAALAVLAAPDGDSRTVEHEGRRIREERDEKGNLLGYYVFNYLKHRAVDATAAERKRRERARVTRDGHARQKTEDRVQKNEPPAIHPSVVGGEGAGGGGPRPNPLVSGRRVDLERELFRLVGREAELTDRDGAEVMAEVTTYEGAKRSKLNAATMTDDRLLNSVLDARARVKRLEEDHGRKAAGAVQRRS